MTPWQKKRSDQAVLAQNEKGNMCVEKIVDEYFKKGWDAATRELLEHEAVMGLVDRFKTHLGPDRYCPCGHCGHCKDWGVLAAFEKFKSEVGG